MNQSGKSPVLDLVNFMRWRSRFQSAICGVNQLNGIHESATKLVNNQQLSPHKKITTTLTILSTQM